MERLCYLFLVNLVMDKIANRPRGFAFLRYATEEESKKAIEGMHGKVSSSLRVCFHYKVILNSIMWSSMKCLVIHRPIDAKCFSRVL